MELEPRQRTIRDLYPNFSKKELDQAAERLDRYLELVVRLYNRIAADPVAYAEFKLLTVSERYVTIKSWRDKPGDSGPSAATSSV